MQVQSIYYRVALSTHAEKYCSVNFAMIFIKIKTSLIDTSPRFTSVVIYNSFDISG